MYSGELTVVSFFNGPELDKIAWYGGNSSQGYKGRGWSTDQWKDKQYPGGAAGPRQKGQKQANAWGIYDILGNVNEWCLDWKADYPEGFVSDPAGPKEGLVRVKRGGSWTDGASNSRAASRGQLKANARLNHTGFRIVLCPTGP